MSSRSSSSPPHFNSYHHVGYVRSAHGIRGEVAVKLFAGRADWRADVATLELLPDGARELRSFGIESIRPHKDGLLIVFAGVGDRDAAEALKGALVYISDDLLEAPAGEAIFLKQILDFTVVDSEGQVLGQIIDFATNGAQDLLVLRRASNDRRALVPFVDAFITAIDFDARRVIMELPDGLLELSDQA